MKINSMKLKTLKENFLEQYRNKNITYDELAAKHGVARVTLTKLFKKEGLKTNKIIDREKINHDYFNKINSSKKAYMLGYFAADGCITVLKTKYSLSKRIQFSCTEGDVELLLFIKKELNLNNKIVKSKRYKVKGTKYLSKPMNSLFFVSEPIFDKLLELGLNERKTYSEFTIPEIKEEFIKYFILGYFDGDGSIVISEGIRANGYKYKNTQFSIVSKGKLLLESISNYFKTLKIKSSIKESKGSYVLRITNKEDIIKIKELFYDSDLGLERKKLKFNKI